MAFTVFINCFLIMYLRWARISGFINQWGQRDGISELYWAVNVACFAVTGFSMVQGQRAPCFFGSWLFDISFLVMDVTYILMTVYAQCAYGCRYGQWGELRRFLITTVLLTMTVPMGILFYLALNKNHICNSDFCQTHGTMEFAIGLYFIAAFWDYLSHSFGHMLLEYINRNKLCGGCLTCFGQPMPLNTQNLVDRVECLILMSVCFASALLASTDIGIHVHH